MRSKSSALVTCGVATIVACCAYLALVRLPETVGEMSGAALTSAVLALGAFGGGWLGRSLWAKDWGPSALAGVAATSTAFFLLGMVPLGLRAVQIASVAGGVLGVAFVLLSVIPWWQLRQIARARAGRADAHGFIGFPDGTKGRADAGVPEGEVLAWPSRRARPAGYRDDGTERYRAAAGTRQGHVERIRRRMSAVMVTTLAGVLGVCVAIDSATYAAPAPAPLDEAPGRGLPPLPMVEGPPPVAAAGASQIVQTAAEPDDAAIFLPRATVEGVRARVRSRLMARIVDAIDEAHTTRPADAFEGDAVEFDLRFFVNAEGRVVSPRLRPSRSVFAAQIEAALDAFEFGAQDLPLAVLVRFEVRWADGELSTAVTEDESVGHAMTGYTLLGRRPPASVFDAPPPPNWDDMERARERFFRLSGAQ
ncbi:MAG: hypothetical protein AAF645_13945 [Myxococcota bacterium]